jgi:signal peptidase I
MIQKILVLSFCFFAISCSDKTNIEIVDLSKNNNNPINCSTDEEREVRGNSMLGLFEPKSTIIIKKGYYNCHPVKKGEVVVFNYKGNLGDKDWIKTVYGVAGDKVELNDKQDTLLLNGKTIKNFKNEIYKVNKVGASYIRMSQKNQMKNNTIPKGFYLVLGTNASSGWDSRRVGLIPLNSFIGRVVQK